MTSGSAYGCRHRLANKLISAIAAPAWSRASALPSLVGLFFATAVAGAAAHEIIDVNKANELVAAADSAVDQESKASDQGTKGGTLYLLGAVLVEATDLLNRDVAAHSGQLTLNGQVLLKGFAQRHLAPQFDEALKRYLLPRQQLQEAAAPSGLFGATHNRPPWASMIERQIDRPIPIPPDFVVNNGLNIRSISCEPIPVPVSATDTMTPPPSWTSDLTRSTRDPSLAAIESIAFVIRLRSTCCTWTWSPFTRGS